MFIGGNVHLSWTFLDLDRITESFKKLYNTELLLAENTGYH